MQEIKYWLSLSLNPESVSNIIACSIFLFGILLRLMKMLKIQRIKIKVFIAFTLSILYFISVYTIIPRFQRFEDKPFGLLILRNEGHKLTDVLGDYKLNQVLAEHLQDQRSYLVHKHHQYLTDEFLQIKAVSWKAQNREEAKALMLKFNADAILWGSIQNLGGSAKLRIWMELEEQVFTTPMSSKHISKFDISIGPKFTLKLTPDSYNFDKFVKNVFNETIPWALVYWSDHDPTAVFNVFKRFWSGSANTCVDIETSHLILKIATNLEKKQDFENAMEFYRIACNCFTHHIQNVIANNSSAQYMGIESSTEREKLIIELRNYAYESKLKEAVMAHELGDIERKMKCWNALEAIDSSQFETLDSLVLERFGLTNDEVIEGTSGLISPDSNGAPIK